MRKIFILTTLLTLFFLGLNVVNAQMSIIDPETTAYNTGNYNLDDGVTIFVSVSQLILSIVGSLTLLMFIYGGFVFLLSTGNSSQVTKAKGILKAAVIGLVIVFASSMIIRLAMQAMGRNYDGSIIEIDHVVTSGQEN